jgi:hypothetical protein
MATQYVIPVGCDNFRKLVTATDQYGNKSLFVDKTKFIQAILADAAEVLLITRPRRFGKTINMSMLQHFFGAEVDGQPTKDLFNGLLISDDQAAMAYQGKYPVIFISLKEVKADNFIDARARIAEVMRQLYIQFAYLKSKLDPSEGKIFQSILDSNASDVALQNALLNLSKYLNQEHKTTTYLLIDEYDTPIQHAYAKKYYDEMVNFVRALLGTSLKGNAWIKQGILTGITRIAKESIFSELNNLKTRSLLDNKYSTYFGFTENEVNDLFFRSGLDCDLVQLKDWYNGYQCGDTLLYNPWSIMNSIDDGGAIKQYWINTSSNDLAIDLILKGGTKVHEQLAILLQGKTIIEGLDNHIVYNNIEQNRAAIWTLLVMAGYLKIIASHNVMDNIEYELALPNKEVKYFYKNIIQVWLSGDGSAQWYSNFLKDLLAGDLQKFEQQLTHIVQSTFSVRDIPKNEPERIYHAFMLGLLASLQTTHEIISNRESGLGYYDFLIIPKDVSQNGVVLEFKAPKDPNADLDNEAVDALQQIRRKKYVMQLGNKGIKKVISVGIAFARKDVRICFEKSWLKPMDDS